jgi:hypothetical protein
MRYHLISNDFLGQPEESTAAPPTIGGSSAASGPPSEAPVSTGIESFLHHFYHFRQHFDIDLHL